MRAATELLNQYAEYHRDRRNIISHFVGVPMIVFAVVLALATVIIPAGPVAVSLAAVASLALVVGDQVRGVVRQAHADNSVLVPTANQPGNPLNLPRNQRPPGGWHIASAA